MYITDWNDFFYSKKINFQILIINAVYLTALMTNFFSLIGTFIAGIFTEVYTQGTVHRLP